MKKQNILGDEIGFIELVDHLGSDLTIVNSARVSFSKRSDWEYETKEEYDPSSRTFCSYKVPIGLKEKDKKLINYLAKNYHHSPFRHVQLQFHVKAPEIVARQFFRHLVGCEYTSKEGYNSIPWNEASQRYSEWKNEFYIPQEFRAQSKDNKQASAGLVADQKTCMDYYTSAIEVAYGYYEDLIAQGVAKEQARGVLPVSFYTEWFVTMSLQATANFIMLRDHDHAQWEIRQYAKAMKELAMTVAPEGVAALVENMK